MTTTELIIDPRTISTEAQASELFRGIFYAADEGFPELMEFFPEPSDESQLANALVRAAQQAEAEGIDAEPFYAMERIIRAYPDADYSA